MPYYSIQIPFGKVNLLVKWVAREVEPDYMYIHYWLYSHILLFYHSGWLDNVVYKSLLFSMFVPGQSECLISFLKKHQKTIWNMSYPSKDWLMFEVVWSMLVGEMLSILHVLLVLGLPGGNRKQTVFEDPMLDALNAFKSWGTPVFFFQCRWCKQF